MRRRIQRPYKWLGTMSATELGELGFASPGSCAIVNTDPSWRRGQHWVAVMKGGIHNSSSTPVVIFYDSFGMPIHILNQNLSKWVSRQTGRQGFVSTSPFPTQNPQSKSCGPLSMYVLCKLPEYKDNLPRLIQSEFIPHDSNDCSNERKAKKFFNL